MNNKQEVPTSTDVLIVGAGPTGMTLAVCLRQLGLDCVVIDRQPKPPNDARAPFVQPRTLEYLRRIHVAGPLVDDGIKGPFSSTESLAHPAGAGDRRLRHSRQVARAVSD